MGSTLLEEAQEASGRKTASGFPGEPQQALFEAPRPAWRSFLHWIVGRDLKGLSALVYGKIDPDQAADNITRTLEGRHKRHFDIEWLDLIAEHFGPAGEEAIVRFVCERYGFQAPIRKPDPQREEERIAKLERTVGDLADAANAAVQELTALRREREARR